MPTTLAAMTFATPRQSTPGIRMSPGPMAPANPEPNTSGMAATPIRSTSAMPGESTMCAERLLDHHPLLVLPRRRVERGNPRHDDGRECPWEQHAQLGHGKSDRVATHHRARRDRVEDEQVGSVAEKLERLGCVALKAEPHDPAQLLACAAEPSGRACGSVRVPRPTARQHPPPALWRARRRRPSARPAGRARS